MAIKKRYKKVYFNSGFAWTKNKRGEKVNVESLDEANEIQSECCGINCCDHSITLPVNSADGTTSYPSKFEFVYVAGTLKLRVTSDFGSGSTVKEIDIT